MRIGIIDDERPARSELSRQILEIEPEAVIFEAASGKEALELFGSEDLDLIFIDVELGDVSGTSLAMAAKKLMPKTGVVFVTAYAEYAVQAFDIGADGYILKPLDPQRLEKVMARFAESAESPIEEKLAVNTGHKVVFIDIPSIVYIETSGRGSVIHTVSGDYFENKTIGRYAEKLESKRFVRIHKSYLVNAAMISEIFPWQAGNLGIRMKGFSAVLPVGRDKSKQLRSMFKMH